MLARGEIVEIKIVTEKWLLASFMHILCIVSFGSTLNKCLPHLNLPPNSILWVNLGYVQMFLFQTTAENPDRILFSNCRFVK